MGISGRPLKALLVDASESRRLALSAALEEQFSPVAVENAHGADGLAGALARRGWDVVLYSGEGPDPVPPRKARALVRLSDPHLPFLSVAPAVRADDLLALVNGFDGDVPVVANPSRLPEAIRHEMAAAGRRRQARGGHRFLIAQQAVTDDIAAVPEPAELLERVARTLAETLGWDYAELWRPSDGSLVCTSAWTAADAGEAIVARAALAPRSNIVPGRGLPGRAFAFRHPEWVTDLRREPAPDSAAGLGSGVAFPICLGDRCDGVIALYAAEVREADADALALFGAVGGQLARYLDSRRGEGGPRPAAPAAPADSEAAPPRPEELDAQFLAHHDAVTGLPNRALLDEHLSLALARSRRVGSGVALLHIDLDNFKLVNDSLGRGAGNELLCALAVRLQQLVRATDLLARVGGDEFLLLLSDLTEDPILVAERVTGEIVQALTEPFCIRDTEFQVSASVGIAACPRDSVEAETLLSHADAAMYQAKQVARGGWAIYNPEREDPLARLSLTSRLRRALREAEFELHYQPIFDLDAKALVGVEALLRWHDPDLGTILPADFIPVAEETGLIEALGDWVVRAVCEQQVAWAARGLHPHISFNVSPRQLKRLDFAERVAMHVAETGADPHRLTAELTESSTLQDHLLTDPILRQLHDLGLNIALDDFGSGYSSLSRLREMPVETLKIDRAFLREVPESREAAAIVTAILRLSRALGRTAVAEGVETEEQRRFLEAQRCPLAQGFLFSRPLPPEELEHLMQATKA